MFVARLISLQIIVPSKLLQSSAFADFTQFARDVKKKLKHKNQGKFPGPYVYQSHRLFNNDAHESTFQMMISVRHANTMCFGTF